MAFVNISLLIGGLCMAIPIVLHLVMRRQPKHLIFPALRFIQQRRDANRRRLQLRQWLLLLLRCLAIAALAVALARPSVHSQIVGDWLIVAALAAAGLFVGLLAVVAWVQARGRTLIGGLASLATILAVGCAAMLAVTLRRTDAAPIGNSRAPVGAVLVFDNSPRMQLIWQNESRLAKAQDIGRWLIRQLPTGSEVAVIDSRPRPAVFAVDLAAAEQAVERLEPTGVPRPLTEVLPDAIKLADTTTRPRREIYVLTDLTRGAWPRESADALAAALAEQAEVLLYVIDLGVEHPHNAGLGEVRLSSQMLTRSQPLAIEADVFATGPAGPATVELYLENPSTDRPIIQDGKTLLPDAVLRHKATVEPAPANDTGDDASSAVVHFELKNLPPGVHHGQLRLLGEDSLAFDNVRHFAVEVQDSVPILVLAPPGTNTKYFVEAVSPYEQRRTDSAKYSCTIEPQAELPGLDLASYAAVCLLDPAPLAPADWDKLTAFVQAGGGVAVFLGHNADTTSFGSDAAKSLLGGRVVQQWRSPGDLFLSPTGFGHPITAFFREHATTTPWDRMPVFRHWSIEDFSPQARLVMPLSNNKPAIIESSIGRGRTITMTTPISDPLRPAGREPWNEIPTSEDAWPYVVIVNEIMNYLVDAGSVKLNYRAGETAVLPNGRERFPPRYQLFTPLDQPQEIAAADDRLLVKFTEYPGAYRLKGNLHGPVIRGFSVNLPPAASRLDRLTREELDSLLGPGRYQFARNQEEIVFGVGEARLGRELFPVLVLLAAALLAVESLLSNRFYRPAPAVVQDRSGAAQAAR